MSSVAVSSDAPSSAVEPATPLARTPLHALHRELGAKMVAFAGYDMPVQYPAGVLAEHLRTRESAGLFDVSHMGQAFLLARDHAAAAAALEPLCAIDVAALGAGRQRYAQLLNEAGGILDDFMVTRPAAPEQDGALMLVVNAARKHEDFALIERALPVGARLVRAPHRSLLALQGPCAVTVLARHAPEVADMAFLDARVVTLCGARCHVTRSGYTGEDGFEISVPAARAEALARALLAAPEVAPVGLGARDSLRLEAGLCLYGHDIDETTSPVEAGLGWSLGRRRLAAQDFPGAARIARERSEGPARRRVGLRPEGRAIAREGAEIEDAEGRPIGRVTSGGFGPSLNGPLAMGLVEARAAVPGAPVRLIVRGKPLPATIASLPFVPHRFHRGAS